MSEITEIDQDSFWALLDRAVDVCGPDLVSEDDWLKDQLWAMGPGEALRFHHIAQRYLQLSDKYGLWSAARLMSGCCIDTDGSFTDFRCWLITQGKEPYLAALKDPDSLAKLEPYRRLDGGPDAAGQPHPQRRHLSESGAGHDPLSG